jgi:hypothetical protein
MQDFLERTQAFVEHAQLAHTRARWALLNAQAAPEIQAPLPADHPPQHASATLAIQVQTVVAARLVPQEKPNLQQAVTCAMIVQQGNFQTQGPPSARAALPTQAQPLEAHL